MHIILIGYRGTGKTTVGRKLSARLGLPFHDIDDMIEEMTGRTIRELVEVQGWGYFREREKESIRAIEYMDRSVIATGGGAVMDAGNTEILKRCGVLIWLYADVKTILERMQRDIGTRERRPSLSGADVLEETEVILKSREPVYRRLADFTVDTGKVGIDGAVDAICLFLNLHNRVQQSGDRNVR